MNILKLFLEADIDVNKLNSDDPTKSPEATDISFDEPVKPPVKPIEKPKPTLNMPGEKPVDVPAEKPKPSVGDKRGVDLNPEEEPVGVMDGSSCIKDVKYTGHNRKLTITFNNGSKYDYFSVPLEVYQGFGPAPSKGEYFHSLVRGKFKYKKMN